LPASARGSRNCRMFDVSALNLQQARAVCHPGGPALVLAAPGSGKTFLIVNRIRYLLEECRADPASILVITFTKAAALSMQQRFIEALGGKLLPVRFGTFHAIFYQILQEYGSYNQSSILSTKEKIWYLQEILEETALLSGIIQGESGPDSQKEWINRLLHLFGVYKNSPARDVFGMLPPELSEEVFRQIFELYQERIGADKKLDFDDMASLCIELFRSKEQVLKDLQGRYRYILIDEYQDTNEMQDLAIHMLAGQRAEILAVGDDDQAIYGFRGSAPDIMRDFTKRYPGAVVYRLDQNYRNTGNILNAALKVIRQNKERCTKEIYTCAEDGEPVRCIGFEKRENEQNYLTNRIVQLQDNISYADMAVITRTNRDAEILAQVLHDKEIPCYVREKARSRYEHFVLQQLRNCLHYISREDALCPALWRRLQGRERVRQMLRKMAPYAVIHYIRKQLGYDEELKRIALEKSDADPQKADSLWIEWQEMLEEFQEQSRCSKGIRGWLQSIERHIRIWEDNNDGKEEKDGVQILTMHSAKGLEFTYVCLMDVNQGIIPGRRTRGKQALEEERRLLYVAMTRAKKILDILYLTGTKEYPRFPSEFLNPLLVSDHSSSTNSSNSALSRNSSKASATASYSSSSSIKDNSGSTLGSFSSSE